MKEHFRVSLGSESRYRLGDRVLLTFELSNISDLDVWLLVWNTPLEAPEVLEYFEVRCDDSRVPYDGRFIKRGDPDPTSYRLIRAGETITETVDLTTAYPIETPGSYTVTLDSRVLDAIVGEGGRLKPVSRRREEHRGFVLDPVWVTFDVVDGGEPRITVAEEVRLGLEEPRIPGAGVAVGKLTAHTPALAGGTAVRQQQVRAAHENAGVYVESGMHQLTSTPGAANTLFAEWFGTHNTGRYAVVRQNFTDIAPPTPK